MNTYPITDFGAVADGVTVNTSAMQKAIDACAAEGGGRVLIDGGTFVTGTLFLHDNIDLHIAAGSVLAASTDGADYPDFESDFFDVRKCPRGSARCLIFIGKCCNVSVSGLGTIDCRGRAFLEHFVDEKGRERYKRNTDILPGRMIFAMSCQNLRFTDFTMLEMAGGWGCWVNDCDNVRVRGIRMQCNRLYPNADGVHINCSSDVMISDCVLHTGDDSVIIRANTNTLKTPRPCERVIVKGCTLSSSCQAVRIGWRGDGEIRYCTLSDLVITDSARGIVIELPDHSSPYDIGTEPTYIHHINFQNILINGCTDRPIFLTVYPDNLFGGMKDIRFSGVNCTAALFPTVLGREDAVIENITFADCAFSITHTRPEAFPIFKHVKGLQCNHVTFDVTETI